MEWRADVAYDSFDELSFSHDHAEGEPANDQYLYLNFQVNLHALSTDLSMLRT